MKKNIKQRVHSYMKSIDTKHMNTNQFIIGFYRYMNGACTVKSILNGVSFESIVRARRKLIEIHPELSRTEKSRDSEEDYKREFQREYNLEYNEI